MIRHLPIALSTFLLTGTLNAQVGINNSTPDASAELDVKSSTRGFLAPRMNGTEMNAIASPAAGLAIYNTDSSSYCIYTGNAWLKMLTGNSASWILSGNDQYSALSGNVGIGTNSPLAKLHVTEGSVVASGTYTGSYPATMVEDAGTRMIWIPEVAAFRAGNVSHVQWDGANLGLYSTAFGKDVMATGTYSIATGYNSTASNQGTVALGEGCFASGANSVALGYYAHTGGHRGAFVFADQINSPNGTNNAPDNNFRASVNNSFNVRASGGLYFYTDQALTASTSLVFKSGRLGVGLSSPGSSLEVNGAIAAKVQTGQIAGTNNPDATSSMWIYTSGAGTITLPTASTCANRIYTLVNKTGSTRTVASYIPLSGTVSANQSLAGAASITVISDGTDWQQIR
jgi:hypothetical protein